MEKIYDHPLSKTICEKFVSVMKYFPPDSNFCPTPNDDNKKYEGIYYIGNRLAQIVTTYSNLEHSITLLSCYPHHKKEKINQAQYISYISYISYIINSYYSCIITLGDHIRTFTETCFNLSLEKQKEKEKWKELQLSINNSEIHNNAKKNILDSLKEIYKLLLPYRDKRNILLHENEIDDKKLRNIEKCILANQQGAELVYPNELLKYDLKKYKKEKITEFSKMNNELIQLILKLFDSIYEAKIIDQYYIYHLRKANLDIS